MNPNPTLIAIFFVLNVFAGLAQLWISAIYWFVHKNQLVTIEVLIRDGSLLLFGAGLVASATYSVIPKPSALRGRRSFFILIVIIMTFAILATGLMYGMKLTAAQDSGKSVEFGTLFSSVQIGWAVLAVLYAFWIAYITDALKEETNVFY